MALERLQEEWDESSVCSCLLALAVNLRIRYPDACHLPELLALMQFMWDSEDRDDELIEFLPIVFLDIAVTETEKLSVTEQILEDINGRFDLRENRVPVRPPLPCEKDLHLRSSPPRCQAGLVRRSRPSGYRTPPAAVSRVPSQDGPARGSGRPGSR
jgi:hypothetical protein